MSIIHELDIGRYIIKTNPNTFLNILNYIL